MEATDITRATMEAIGFYNEQDEFEAQITALHERYEQFQQREEVG